MMRTVLVVASLAAGCGSDGGMNSGDDAPPGDAPPVTPDGPPIPEGYTRLIGRTWSIPAGSLDKYKCVRFTVPEDMYITNIIAQAPLGTHHTVLSFVGGNAPPGPDGEQDCNVNTLGMVMLYASGVGTSPLQFPDGVGVKISAGQQIHLNLHLFNATDGSLSGDSAILVKAQATPPPMLAEMVFAGNMLFSIPSANPPTPTTIEGGCTVNRPYSLFAVWPHMHQIAHHQRVELIRGGTTTVLHDLAFDFQEQKYYPQSPEIQVQTGDRIRVKCTYLNDTGRAIRFGDSSNDEMCFAGLYRYPAANAGLFECTGF